MTEWSKYGVELIDEVSEPSQSAADSLRNLERRLRAVQGSAANTSAAVAGLARSRAFELIGSGATKLSGMLENTFMMGVSKVKQFGEQLVKGVVHSAQYAEASKAAISALTGSPEAGAQAFEAARALANDLGLDVESTVHHMQHLLAMQFNVADAMTQIKLSTDLQAIGATAQQAESALRAITQIKAKGKLQSEELVGQLAETGLSTVLVYEALSKNLGKSLDEVKKMLADGKITADVGIKAIEGAIMKKVHEDAPGEAGRRFSTGTFAGLKNRMNRTTSDLYLKLAETIPKLLPKLQQAMGVIGELVASIDIEKTGKFVESIIDMLLSAVPVVKEFALGFMEGFKEMSTVFGGIKFGTDTLRAARDLGKSFATILGQLASALTTIAKLMPLIATDTGKWLLGGVYVATKLTSLAGAVGSVTALGGASGGGGGGGGGFASSAAGVVAKTVGGELTKKALPALGTAATSLLGPLSQLAISLGWVALAVAGAAAAGYAAYKLFEWWDTREERAAKELNDNRVALERRRHRLETVEANWKAVNDKYIKVVDNPINETWKPGDLRPAGTEIAPGSQLQSHVPPLAAPSTVAPGLVSPPQLKVPVKQEVNINLNLPQGTPADAAAALNHHGKDVVNGLHSVLKDLADQSGATPWTPAPT